MPPRKFSRHSFCAAIKDEDTGVFFLTDRVPYAFRNRPDNIHHVVQGGDSLWSIAGMYYDGSFDRPEGLWWVIADFQPDPVYDPTIELQGGSLIIVPSVRTVIEEIFSENRRREAE